jgi:hypothetical protein
VLGERAGLHDDGAVLSGVEVDEVDDGGQRVDAPDQGSSWPTSSLLRKERTVRQSYPAAWRSSSSRRSAGSLPWCHSATGTDASIGL